MELLVLIAVGVFVFYAIGWAATLLWEILKVLWEILDAILNLLAWILTAILFVVFFPITVPWLLWSLWKDHKAAKAAREWRELDSQYESLIEKIEDLKRRGVLYRTDSPQTQKNPFGSTPKPKPKPQKKGYTSDWGSVSNRYKKAQGWRCEHCGVYCGGPGDKPLLHVHHWDRNPQNTRDANLVALCIQCHSRQPGAGHKRLRTASKRDGRWQRITRLREK
jgi:5-methylcytosine-specific restriction endonuclease McrA